MPVDNSRRNMTHRTHRTHYPTTNHSTTPPAATPPANDSGRPHPPQPYQLSMDLTPYQPSLPLYQSQIPMHHHFLNVPTVSIPMAIPNAAMSEFNDFPSMADSPESLPDELLYASFPDARHTSSPPLFHRSNSYPSYEKMTGVKPQETHTISRTETGEDEFIRKSIHRLTEHDKQSMRPYYNRESPNFICKLPGCREPWIHNRTQFKGHLLEHGICFDKPWACSCGSQFSRQVEAARHLEDLKPCPKCHNSGRKLKGFGGELICHRCQKKEKMGSTKA